MKAFNEHRSTCRYRDKQRCTYWDRENQCHQLACPIISQQLDEHTEQRIPRHIKESIDNFDRYRERIPPIDQEILETTQRSQDEGIQQKEKPSKKTQGTTVVTITTKQAETDVPQQNTETIKSGRDDTHESVDQHLTEPPDFRPTEGLQQQPQQFQERQETIVVTPGQIECDRCGEPINTETCTRIQKPSGEILYMHPNGQCQPRWDKIKEVRERWLKQRK